MPILLHTHTHTDKTKVYQPPACNPGLSLQQLLSFPLLLLLLLPHHHRTHIISSFLLPVPLCIHALTYNTTHPSRQLSLNLHIYTHTHRHINLPSLLLLPSLVFVVCVFVCVSFKIAHGHGQPMSKQTSIGLFGCPPPSLLLPVIV